MPRFLTFALVLLTAGLTAGAEPHDPIALGELTQYIFFNRIPGRLWQQQRPSSFTAAGFTEVVDGVGTRGNDRLRIGISFIFSMLEGPLDVQSKSLRRLLEAAEQADVPILVTLDGQNWWQSRPDLWNWWDPDLPGFDEANRHNVEWTGWGPEHAIKISWRNWGQQVRVRPAPNLASPAFLAEHWKGYDALIPIILDWYRRLPPERRYLFGGVKLGWEASINVNAYHYPDGNRIFEASPGDASNDPTERDMTQGWAFGGAKLGHAAAYTSGLRTSGELTREDIETLVHRYLRQLVREARRRGLPTHLIFTHQGGTYAPWEKHLSFKPAIVEESIPGWSFYSHDPPDCGSLPADLEAAGRTQWAAAEWWRGATDTAGWVQRFEQTLSFKQCRHVCVYNWETFAKIPEALAAVRVLVAATTRPAPNR